MLTQADQGGIVGGVISRCRRHLSVYFDRLAVCLHWWGSVIHFTTTTTAIHGTIRHVRQWLLRWNLRYNLLVLLITTVFDIVPSTARTVVLFVLSWAYLEINALTRGCSSREALSLTLRRINASLDIGDRLQTLRQLV